MMNIQIVPMVTDEDINGKGYVHWKSWHETYTGLVDPAYMEKTTLEKCIDMAHRWPQNLMVAKDGDKLMNAAFEKLSDYGKIAVWVLKGNDKAIRFYEKYEVIRYEITPG